MSLVLVVVDAVRVPGDSGVIYGALCKCPAIKRADSITDGCDKQAEDIP